MGSAHPGNHNKKEFRVSLTFEFCDMRAREAATAAEEATLGNVKERALRSESAWREMADRLRAIKDGRQAIERERAESALLS